jgi:hypothetical protein
MSTESRSGATRASPTPERVPVVVICREPGTGWQRSTQLLFGATDAARTRRVADYSLAETPIASATAEVAELSSVGVEPTANRIP